jgi:hypothetical protein
VSLPQQTGEKVKLVFVVSIKTVQLQALGPCLPLSSYFGGWFLTLLQGRSGGRRGLIGRGVGAGLEDGRKLKNVILRKERETTQAEKNTLHMNTRNKKPLWYRLP